MNGWPKEDADNPLLADSGIAPGVGQEQAVTGRKILTGAPEF
jgi:hypothetical protein